MARTAAHVAAACLLAESAMDFHVALPEVLANGWPSATGTANSHTSRPLVAPAPLNAPLNRRVRHAGSNLLLRASSKLDEKTEEEVKVSTVAESNKSSTVVPEMDGKAYAIVGLCCLCGE